MIKSKKKKSAELKSQSPKYLVFTFCTPWLPDAIAKVVSVHNIKNLNISLAQICPLPSMHAYCLAECEELSPVHGLCMRANECIASDK